MVLMLVYWELNPDFNPNDLGQIATELLQKQLWPTEGVKMLGWWITPDYWGVTVVEVDTEENAMKDANIWRLAKPGIFKVYKSSIAMQAPNVPPLLYQLNEKLKEE